MQIASTRLTKAAAPKAPVAPKEEATFSSDSSGGGIKDFYESNKTLIHIGGGALLGAGIATYGAGLSGENVMSAAGSGAFGGFFAGQNTEKAMFMGGGAVVGATIANLAGVPGLGVMSAAGTGAFVGWLFG